MTIQCRNVLKNLRLLSSDEECVFGFLRNTSCICLEMDKSKRYDYTAYKKKINGIMKQLVMDGYLAYADDHEYGLFTLTHKGLHPYQIQWESLKSFLFRSVFVSIAVSFFTSLITVSVQAWLLSP